MSILDKVIEAFSPAKALEREQHRLALSEVRSYAAARPNRTSGTYSRRSSRANDEVASAHRALAGGAQSLVRNTALAHRIKAVIATNIVGTGIQPEFLGGAKRQMERYKNSFEEWANSTAIDYEGHHNFYGLQHLWAGVVVESGGVFVRRIVNAGLKFPLVLQTLEQQYLDETKQGVVEGSEIVSGIQYSKAGEIQGYWLKTRLHTMNEWDEPPTFYPADEIIHIYRKDRPGQHLGVSWLHPVADLVEMRQEWRDAALTQQRIAACFGVIIKEPPKDMGLGSQDFGIRDESGMPYSEIEPGMIAYTDANTDISTVSPPSLSGAQDFNDQILQDIASGVGITKEQLTNDFSKVNWASGRLARGEFYSNLDRWQYFMMIPALNRVMDWFDDIYAITAGRVNSKRTWVIPHRSAVNPKEELDVDISKVRNAAMTPQQFTSKHGLRFEDAIEGWKEAKKLIGDLPFDFDPSKFSVAGNQLDDNDAASSNAANPNKPKNSDNESKKSKTDDSGKGE